MKRNINQLYALSQVYQSEFILKISLFLSGFKLKPTFDLQYAEPCRLLQLFGYCSG